MASDDTIEIERMPNNLICRKKNNIIFEFLHRARLSFGQQQTIFFI